MDKHETIIIEKKDQVGRITFNRPDQLNALNDKMGEEFHDALKDLEKDPQIRCVIITGAGRAFSAGEDITGLKERSADPITADNKHPSLGDHLRRKYHPIIIRMRNMEKPIVARINGIAAGSGASIALASDIRIASENGGLKQAFIGVGLVPDSGSTYFLTRMVGPGRALELMMTGRTIPAKECEQLGLIHKVVSKDALDSAVEEMAFQLANGPTKALALSKKMVARASTADLDEAMEYEALSQDIAGKTADHLEAVKAFLEKRKARFVGH